MDYSKVDYRGILNTRETVKKKKKLTSKNRKN